MEHDLKVGLLMITILFFIWLGWYWLFSEPKNVKQAKPITDEDYDF